MSLRPRRRPGLATSVLLVVGLCGVFTRWTRWLRMRSRRLGPWRPFGSGPASRSSSTVVSTRPSGPAHRRPVGSCSRSPSRGIWKPSGRKFASRSMQTSLYIGAALFDSDPSGILGYQKERDPEPGVGRSLHGGTRHVPRRAHWVLLPHQPSGSDGGWIAASRGQQPGEHVMGWHLGSPDGARERWLVDRDSHSVPDTQL